MIEEPVKEVAFTFRDLAYLARVNNGLKPRDKDAVLKSIEFLADLITDIKTYKTNQIVELVLDFVDNHLRTVEGREDPDAIDVAKYLNAAKRRIQPWSVLDVMLSDADSEFFENFFEALADHLYPLPPLVK